MSPTSQNEMIEIIGDLTVKTIAREIHEDEAFSLMQDRTTDASTKEQVSLHVRHAHHKTRVIKERLVRMTSIPVCDDESLCDCVVRFKGLGPSHDLHH